MSSPQGPRSGAGPEHDAFAALAYGWRSFRANAGTMLTLVLVPLIAELLVAALGKALIDSAARRFLFQITGIVIGAVGGLGVRRAALMITAGERPDARTAFRYDRWSEWIAFAVVFSLLESVGLVLCVIPGVLFLAYFGLAPYFFIDRGMGIGDALRESRRAVVEKGLAFAVLTSIVVGVLGIIVCAVGVVVSEAVATIALAFLYRYASGQRVAQPVVKPVAE